uniref:Uncharacterized protein n=1 Tax=Panagrolaimus davidi TaxID=227884 RepID=A0A914QVT8_9BILA
MDMQVNGQTKNLKTAKTKKGAFEVQLSPVSQGSTKLSVYDLCIEGARLDISIKATDVNKVKIFGSELVEMNAIVPLKIKVHDIDDQKFSEDDVKMMDLDIVSQRDFARLTPVSLLAYHARGISMGATNVIATVKSSTGTVVQLHIYFNKYGMVEINSIDLIKSAKTLGETTVTAVVTNGKSNDIISQDTAVVGVVSLSGIHLILSSTIVEEGDIISAHIVGLDQDETPCSFGGAQYPFTVVLKISATEVLAFDLQLTNILLSDAGKGSVPLCIHRQTSAFNETTFVNVDVMHVKSLHLPMEMSVVLSLASATIPTLPQGCKIRIPVKFRDSRGRLFDSANYVALENNRTFDIVLKEAGETVFRIWDTVNPRLSAYIRLPVGDVITPERELYVGDLVCFISPVKVRQAAAKLIGLTWGTSGQSDKFVNFIHRNTGNAVMVSPGDASVYVKLCLECQNATTFSSIKIRQPSSLQFINSPKYVSNIKRRVFAFPVQFIKTLNDTSQNIYGCDATDLTVFSGVLPPFDCVSSFSGGVAPISAVNIFTTRTVFDPTIGSYACVLTDQIFELKSHQINDFENSQLTVSAHSKIEKNYQTKLQEQLSSNMYKTSDRARRDAAQTREDYNSYRLRTQGLEKEQVEF